MDPIRALSRYRLPSAFASAVHDSGREASLGEDPHPLTTHSRLTAPVCSAQTGLVFGGMWCFAFTTSPSRFSPASRMLGG